MYLPCPFGILTRREGCHDPRVDSRSLPSLSRAPAGGRGWKSGGKLKEILRGRSFHTSLDFGSIRVGRGSKALHCGGVWGALGVLGWWEGHIFGFGCGAGWPFQVFSAPLCPAVFCRVVFGSAESVVFGLLQAFLV